MLAFKSSVKNVMVGGVISGKYTPDDADEFEMALIDRLAKSTHKLEERDKKVVAVDFARPVVALIALTSLCESEMK